MANSWQVVPASRQHLRLPRASVMRHPTSHRGPHQPASHPLHTRRSKSSRETERTRWNSRGWHRADGVYLVAMCVCVCARVLNGVVSLLTFLWGKRFGVCTAAAPVYLSCVFHCSLTWLLLSAIAHRTSTRTTVRRQTHNLVFVRVWFWLCSPKYVIEWVLVVSLTVVFGNVICNIVCIYLYLTYLSLSTSGHV